MASSSQKPKDENKKNEKSNGTAVKGTKKSIKTPEKKPSTPNKTIKTPEKIPSTPKSADKSKPKSESKPDKSRSKNKSKSDNKADKNVKPNNKRKLKEEEMGIACAGTGLKEAIALLDPMTNDPVNFVRQGALIASAMILIQQTETTCPRVKDFRALYAKVIVDKHEDVMAKFGAILAQGIIDAGGRNVTVSLQSRTGHTNMLAVVGALVFTQYWYWFPLAHCLALAFTPTCLIALNAQLKMPKLEVRSNARPSVYAYPAPLEEKKREEREKVTTAVLSIAARARRRESEKRARSPMRWKWMDVDQPSGGEGKDSEAKEPASSSSSLSSGTTSGTKEKEEKKKDSSSSSKDKDIVVKEKEKEKKIIKDEDKEKIEKDKKESEPSSEILQNPARILRQQLKIVQLVDGSQYAPVKDIQIGGIVMVKYVKPDSEEELVEPVAAFGPKPDEEKESDPPEPFEYTEN